ncbi:MAG: hypothetical protein CM15mV80_040 [uncultured marine virus]|nr:MAG: hypothetical protein CM15mV80_040 [uncultured marine virus]
MACGSDKALRRIETKGIRVTKVSPFYSVCSDVFLVPKPNQIEKHYHSLSSSEKP